MLYCRAGCLCLSHCFLACFWASMVSPVAVSEIFFMRWVYCHTVIGPHSTYPLIHPSLSFLRLQPTPHHRHTLLLSPGAPTPCSACPDLSPRMSGHSFLAPRALLSRGSRVLPVSDTSDALHLVWSSPHTPDRGQVFIPEAPTHLCLPSMVG